MSEKINLLGYNQNTLQLFFEKLGEPSFRAAQLLKWIHQKNISNFEDMTDFSKSLRTKLSHIACIESPGIFSDQTASDGTRKWVLQLQDGNKIETIFIPDGTRGTLCISSQVGCILNCRFCYTGKQGFSRNLRSDEIIGQVWNATRMVNITNVVFMGMGEPLYNFTNVCTTCDILLNDCAYGLSRHRVTISTSGVVPMMEQLKTRSSVALAVSLHAPNNQLRNQLVPLNKKYPLEPLISVCKNYFAEEKKQSVTYEYVLLNGINDTTEHAAELITLIGNHRCKVNLIPFNTFPYSEYQCSTPETIHHFQKKLMNAGIRTFVRRTRGETIDAACGQLAGQVQDKTHRNSRWQRGYRTCS